MSTATDENAPAQRGNAGEGTETHMTAGLDTTVSPTSADVANLLRCRPQPGAPADEVERWVEWKHRLLRAIERTTG